MCGLYMNHADYTASNCKLSLLGLYFLFSKMFIVNYWKYVSNIGHKSLPCKWDCSLSILHYVNRKARLTQLWLMT